MQKRTLEAALQNASVDDPVVADRLAYFGPALLKVCEVARRLPTTDLPDLARIEEALVRPDRTLLADGPVAIDPALFEEVVREFAVVLHDAAHAEGSLSDAMKAVDWTRFTTPDLVEVARTRPSEYFDRVEALAEGDDLLSYYILPVLGFALRAHLDRFAAQASSAFDRTDDVTDHDRPLVCPVCGGLRRASRLRVGACDAHERQRQAPSLRHLRRALEVRAHPLRRLRHERRLRPFLRARRSRSRPTPARLQGLRRGDAHVLRFG